MRRFFVNIKQGLGKDLVLVDSEHNHLANVLRLKTGDQIIAVCGDEFDYSYQINKITKQSTELKYLGAQKNMYNPKVKLTVYMGVIKHENLAVAVQKLNEIGVCEIVLFKSSNCQNIPAKIEKLRTVAEQSCKQCGRSIPLNVRGVLDFEQMIKELPSGAVFCDEIEITSSISSPCKDVPAIIIGPEGGFTQTERGQVRSGGAVSVSLGKRILRAETAAIVASSIVLSKLGEI